MTKLVFYYRSAYFVALDLLQTAFELLLSGSLALTNML